MIKIENAYKIYNSGKSTEVVALKNLSFIVNRGDLIAITGPSGSGKSTLLNIISGIDKLTSGQYFYDEIDITKANNYQISNLRNKKISIILQDFGLLGNETVIQNVRIPLIIAGINGKKSKEIAMSALTKLGINDLAYKKVNTLSGGQRQRTAIARAIASSCEIILADEPTGALDTANAKEVAQIFKDMNENGITIIIVTHNIELANMCPVQYSIVDGILSRKK